VRSGPAALEQQGVSPIVAGDETHRAVAVPHLEGVGFVVALPVRPLNLQDDVAGGNDMRRIPTDERLLEPQVPLLRALLDEPRKLFFPGSSV
jgi:hypothetical protein